MKAISSNLTQRSEVSPLNFPTVLLWLQSPIQTHSLAPSSAGDLSARGTTTGSAPNPLQGGWICSTHLQQFGQTTPAKNSMPTMAKQQQKISRVKPRLEAKKHKEQLFSSTVLREAKQSHRLAALEGFLKALKTPDHPLCQHCPAVLCAFIHQVLGQGACHSLKREKF